MIRLAVGFFLGALTAVAAERTPVPAVEARPHECEVKGGLCATFPVWEDRERKAGRKIGLNIVVLKATGKDPAPDPIFLFDGGPGAGATRAATGLSVNSMRVRRDIVLIDQRGTGRSNPLDCDLYGSPPDLRLAARELFPSAAVRACRERLEKIADLRMYTTAPGMDDVDDVRQWLGYDKINVWGGSYGSYAAQVYLRRHPEHVRAAVLAGVDPVDELVPLHHAWAGQRSVNLLFDACRADAACNAAFPNLREEFRGIFERVKNGMDVEVQDPQGHTVKVRPSAAALAEGIRHALYSDDGHAFPLMIHRAAAGDLGPLVQRSVNASLELKDILSTGMLLSVSCAEQIPYITDAMLARETAGTFLADLRVKEQRAACAEWVRAPIPDSWHKLVRSDVPVLLVSGGRDPVTPPDLAERVAKELPNSLHVVFPGASHGNYGFCEAVMMAQFIEKGSVKGLDTSCAGQRRTVRFSIE